MEAQFALLKTFVDMCKADPNLLHHPSLAFYRDYLESLGAKIPVKPATSAPPKKEEEKKEESEPMEAESQEEEPIPEPELDTSGVVEADSGEPLPMGDSSKQPSDEDVEKSGEERSLAQSALSEGQLDTALTHFTNAISLNPHSAALFAKRAQVLVQLKRPVAAIADCNKAIELNADSAIAYKWRGRAHRMLGHWVAAHTDFACACKIDYDDSVNEWLKEVEPNAKKVKEYERAVERRKEEKELAERRERVRRAQEERARASAAGDRETDDSEDSGIGAFFSMLAQDPECKEALQDPTVMTAVMEIMQNPMSLAKHASNPKVMTVFGKLQKMFGGGGGMGGMFGGMGAEPAGCCPSDDPSHSHSSDSPPSQPSSAPKAPPMPDLD